MSEILAPAGDLISLKCAVASGADAVYLGLSAFNARIKAENFTLENISEVTRYCHLFAVKVYVTVNISVKDDELSDVRKLIIACRDAKVDAFIVTDLAVLKIIKEECPYIPAHASTQFGVCNLLGAKFAESVGFSRVVLSREATLSEIKKIKENTNLEIEYFVHGALCVAFSGKCLMSSMINGGSGNRGRCLQPCRLSYTEEKTGKSGYLLSTSDLCLIENLKELEDAGVCSFKIEGRLRRPEYVYNTVKTYRKVIDNNFKVEKKDLDILKSSYNRGNFTKGYSFDDTRDIMSTKVQGNIGLQAGEIIKYDGKYAVVSGNFPFKVGQGYKLFDLSGNEIGGGIIQEVNGNKVKIPNGKVKAKINITSDGAFEFEEKKLPIELEYNLSNNTLSLFAKYKDIRVGSRILVENANNNPLDDDTLISSFTKLGDTNFSLNSISGKIQGAYFTTRKELNLLRRELLNTLEENIVNLYKNNEFKGNITKSTLKNAEKYNNRIAIEVQNKNQINDEVIKHIDILVFYPDIFNKDTINSFLKKVNGEIEVFIKLPVNARENDISVLKEILNNDKISGIYCDSPYAVELSKELNLNAFLGIGLNIFNTSALNEFEHKYYMVSSELSEKEISTFSSPFVFSYGYLPLMNLSHCVTKLVTGCNCNNCKYFGGFVYRDRGDFRFKIYRNKVANCYFTLYNSKIHDISSKIQKSSINFYLNMLECSRNDIINIVSAFKNKNSLNTLDKTNGHFVKGVQ